MQGVGEFDSIDSGAQEVASVERLQMGVGAQCRRWLSPHFSRAVQLSLLPLGLPAVSLSFSSRSPESEREQEARRTLAIAQPFQKFFTLDATMALQTGELMASFSRHFSPSLAYRLNVRSSVAPEESQVMNSLIYTRPLDTTTVTTVSDKAVRFSFLRAIDPFATHSLGAALEVAQPEPVYGRPEPPAPSPFSVQVGYRYIQEDVVLTAKASSRKLLEASAMHQMVTAEEHLGVGHMQILTGLLADYSLPDREYNIGVGVGVSAEFLPVMVQAKATARGEWGLALMGMLPLGPQGATVVFNAGSTRDGLKLGAFLDMQM